MYSFEDIAKMLLLNILSISLLMLTSASISIGSDSASLLSCSKFHFEEKVLEKLVRLEHKMELNEKRLKKWEDAISSKLYKMEESIKQTETFVKTVRENQLQEQSRLNVSYHEILQRFKGESKNETKFYGEQMNIMLKSLSSKIEEISVAEKNRKTNLESIQNILYQEQIRFSKSFDLTLDNFRLSSNKSIYEMIAKQEKDYEELMAKRTTVAFSAYTRNSQAITSYTNIKFEEVWTNIGNGYDSSTGIFTAPRQGVYHITAVIISVSGKRLHLHLRHNNKYTAGSYVTGDGHKTGTFDVVFSLQKADKVSVGSRGSYTVYSDSNAYTSFSGHLIT